MFFEKIKKEHKMITALLMGLGVVIAFVTIIDRLSSLTTPVIDDPDYKHTFKIKWVTFITEDHGAAQIYLHLSSLPDYSDEWEDKPKVIVKWRMTTLSGATYSGTSESKMARPYRTFIFTVREGLEEELGKTHTEKIFINEYRRRIIRETVKLHVEVYHPETEELLDEYEREYDLTKRPANY